MSTRQAVKQRFNIVGEHPRLNLAIDIALQVAPTEVTVLVNGENGTGKDVFSKIIHQFSRRKHKSFIAINCGAIPDGTIDSELFGHEKGSFTSAYEARKGYFEEVNGGVIFLDEIAEMPLATQARLLRVLENGEYLRVGSSKVQKTDVRVIAATNKNLIEAIRNGKFREDLYFRLNTITIYVPPLRERGNDIELLFRYFAHEFGLRYGREAVQIAPNAIRYLYEYHWPGNVRELRNFAEKLTVLVKGDTVSEADMEEYLPVKESQLPVLASNFYRTNSGNNNGHGQNYTNDYSPPNTPPPYGYDPEFMLKMMFDLKNEMAFIKQGILTLLQKEYQLNTENKNLANLREVILQPNYVPEPRPQPVPLVTNLLEEGLSIENQERDLIEKALTRHRHNRKRAASELGISERTLYRKIKNYGLE